MDKDKILNLVNNYGIYNWAIQSYKNEMFQEYISEFLKEVNEECRQAGWNQRQKLLVYETIRGKGKGFCIINSKTRVVLNLGQFDFLKYIEIFEENKEMIRKEALDFVAEYPNMSEKYIPLAKQFIEYISNRPYFFHKDRIMSQIINQNGIMKVTVKYGSAMSIFDFNILSKVEEYNIDTICRGATNYLANTVASDICARIIYPNVKGKKALPDPIDTEIKWAINYVIKYENAYEAKQLIESKRISKEYEDKLNAMLMALKISGKM